MEKIRVMRHRHIRERDIKRVIGEKITTIGTDT
jgi:hypothetical protein